MASYFLSEGTPVFFPVAQAGWVDLATQTPFGFNRVQVKTSGDTGKSVRVRGLGSCRETGVEPADRYDTLAVVNLDRLWLIPAQALHGRDTITLRPLSEACSWDAYRRK